MENVSLLKFEKPKFTVWNYPANILFVQKLA